MLHGYFDLPTFAFWNFGNIWTGSIFTNFSYRIFKDTVDETDILHTVVWIGMKCFDLVAPEEYAFDHREEFSAEGLEKTTAFLNEKAEEYKNGKL